MGTVKIGSKVIDYEVVRTDRKSLGINIEPKKGIIVRSPNQITDDKIKEIVKGKGGWILEKLDELAKIKPEPLPKEFLSGEKLPYIGKRYRLKMKEKKEVNNTEVRLFQGKFIIEVPLDLKEDKKRDIIREEFIKWYRKHAKEKILERVEKYKDKLGVEPNNVKIKKQKKRWGSCSSKGNININWKIIMAPMSVIDYIVVHELAHLKYDNHSNDFWQLVETIMPNYEDRAEWLKIHGPELTL